MTETKVYDGKPHAEAREVRFECSHKRLTYQPVIVGKPMYCMECGVDRKVTK